MSHAATNWAITVRGIKPALKIVLWHLCDCHNPSRGGIFPSQEYLSDACEIPRSTLNVYLDQLQELGLIARERRRKDGSKQQESTRYYIPMDPEFSAFCEQKPSPETGHGSEEAESRNGTGPSPENGESRVQNLDSNPVREPVNEPVREREARERDLSGSEGKAHSNVVNADLTKRVQKFCTGTGYREGEWPKWATSTIGHIAKQFAQLSPSEQDLACEWRDAFLAKCKRERLSRPMPVANYFRDKVWEMLTDTDKAAVRPVAGGAPVTVGGKAIVGVFGPAYAAARAWALLQGPVEFDLPEDLRKRVQATHDTYARTSPIRAMSYRQEKNLMLDERGLLIFPHDFERQERERRAIDEGYPEVKRLHDAAKERTNVTVDPIFERLKDLCEAVPVDSPMWHRWREYHDERGWRFVPTPAAMKVVFFPKGGPEGLDEFEGAARAAMGMERGNDAA